MARYLNKEWDKIQKQKTDERLRFPFLGKLSKRGKPCKVTKGAHVAAEVKKALMEVEVNDFMMTMGGFDTELLSHAASLNVAGNAQNELWRKKKLEVLKKYL